MDIFATDLPTARKTGLAENDFVVKQTNPYGFWKINREKGQVPDTLSGAYTTYERAVLAIQTYLKNDKTRNAPRS